MAMPGKKRLARERKKRAAPPGFPFISREGEANKPPGFRRLFFVRELPNGSSRRFLPMMVMFNRSFLLQNRFPSRQPLPGQGRSPFSA